MHNYFFATVEDESYFYDSNLVLRGSINHNLLDKKNGFMVLAPPALPFIPGFT